jgi:hypothetical protein
MAKNNQKNRQRAKVLATKGASQKTIRQKTGVSKTAAKKFTQKAATPTPTPTPPPTQATPTSFLVTPDTKTPNINFTAAERAGGNIYGTDIGNGLTAYTQGAPIKDPSVLRQQIGLSATPETAATTAAAGSTGAGKKGKGRKKLTIRGVEIGKSLSGKEAMKLAATGLGERAIDKALAKGASIQGSAERRLTKGQLSTPEQRLLGSVFDTQRQDMNGGLRGSGIPSALDPRSKDVQALSGLGLERGQRFQGATGSGAPILATKDMLGGTSGGGGQRGAGDAATPSTAEISPTATTSDFGMEDLGTDMGISASDQAYMDAIDSLSQSLTDQFSGLNQSVGDLGSIFEGINLNDPITAEILRKYGVGRNYNIDAIRAALRRPQGRSAYLRSSMGGGTNPFRSALSFAPQLSIA